MFPKATKTASLIDVTVVLLATDSDALFTEIDGILADDDTSVFRVREGADVTRAIAAKRPDLVLLDLQIGNMGGVASCIAVRQEEGFGRLDERPVALLLDRDVDSFIASEAGADGWLIKPINSLRLKRMAKVLLSGESSFEGQSVAS